MGAKPRDADASRPAFEGQISQLPPAGLIGGSSSEPARRLDTCPEPAYVITVITLGRHPMDRSSRTIELKVVAIGNSRGVRLPKELLQKYAIKGAVIAEERDEGVLLRSKRDRRLGWDETFKEMAKEHEDWRDLDATLADGLDPEERW